LPVDGAETEPYENGRDDYHHYRYYLHARCLAENALIENDEVEKTIRCMAPALWRAQTGKIKAIANLGRRAGWRAYIEDYNYSLGRRTEPVPVFFQNMAQ